MNIIKLSEPEIIKTDRTIAVMQDFSEILAGLNSEKSNSNIKSQFGLEDKMVIAFGHQSNWYGPGVWIKAVVADLLAKTADATALEIVLDHDIYSTSLKLPCKSENNSYYIKKVAIETAQPIGIVYSRKCKTTAMDNIINAVGADFEKSLLWQLRGQIKQNRFTSPASSLTAYCREIINNALGMKIRSLPVSRIVKTDAFFKFTANIIADYMRFVNCYNAVADYSRYCGISRLDCNSKKQQMPFWLINSSGIRETMYIEGDKEIKIYRADRELGVCKNNIDEIAEYLKSVKFMIAPKAITLMLFVRLYLTDVFIHGVGGYKYSKITDYLIENYYNQKVRPVAMTTMTLMLDLKTAASNRNAEDGYRLAREIDLLKQKLRKIKFKPEQYLSTKSENGEIKKLIAQKYELIEQLNLVLSAEKIAVNTEISAINKRLMSFLKREIEITQNQLKELYNARENIKILQDRNYFYGLFDYDSLTDCIKTVQSQINSLRKLK